jgi:hypothetical protein
MSGHVMQKYIILSPKSADRPNVVHFYITFADMAENRLNVMHFCITSNQQHLPNPQATISAWIVAVLLHRPTLLSNYCPRNNSVPAGAISLESNFTVMRRVLRLDAPALPSYNEGDLFPTG